jgi:hypothetical protein
MNKEEILAKSREEHQKGDEREKQLRMGSAVPVIITMGVVGVLLILVEGIFLDTVILSYGVRLMLHASLCVQNWYLLAVLKKKYLIITGVIFTVGTVLNVYFLIDIFISMR